MSAPHSKRGASGAHRWLECPGSINAEDAFASETGIVAVWSAYAEEGTFAHKISEDLLRGSYDVSDARTFCESAGYPDMINHVLEYVDFVNMVVENEGALLEVEQRVDYTKYVQDGFGTCDVILIYAKTLHIIDLKFGQGLRVDAFENPQGMLYALGALLEAESFFEIEDVKITIHQPRLDHVSTYETTPAALKKFGTVAKKAAKKTEAEDAPRIPGEVQCKFCKAKSTCPALTELTGAVVMADFEVLGEDEEIVLPAPSKLSDYRLRKIMSNKSLIDSFLKSVEDHIRTRVEGDGFDGYKLVDGQSRRKWENEDVAEGILSGAYGDKVLKTSLLSPAQVEKAVGKSDYKETVADLVVKRPGSPTLVPASDPRQSIAESTADEFEEIDEEF